MPDMPSPQTESDLAEATLTFREQADGRKVGRLPGGKVVLLSLADVDRVSDGEQWRVRLQHRETFAIAYPLERTQGFSNPLVSPGQAQLLHLFAHVSQPPADRAPEECDRSPAASSDAGPRAVVVPGPVAPANEGQVAVAAATKLEAPLPASLSARQAERARYELARLVRRSDRVAIFVDGANMDHAGRSAGYFVDYRKARELFVGEGVSYAGFYYLVDVTATDPLQQRYLDFLAHAGFIVRRKPLKVIRDEDTGEQVMKGNLDTEIVLDMLNTVGNYDVAFLFSGDSDFERAIELLRSRGKRVYVVTSRRSCSRELAYVADKPIFFLEELRDLLARSARVRPEGTD